MHFVKNTQAIQVDEYEDMTLLAQPPQGLGTVHWDDAEALDIRIRELLDRAEPDAFFDELPDTINESKKLTTLRNALSDYLYRARSLRLLYNPATKLYSRPDESEREFRARVSQVARELRDAEVDTLEGRYRSRIRTLEDRLRNARVALERSENTARQRKQDALITAGETVFSLFSGRRRSISSAARKVTQATTTKSDINAAEEKVSDVESDLEAMRTQLKRETEAIVERWESTIDTFEEMPITPRRTDVQVSLFALAWVPTWYIVYRSGNVTQTAAVPAY